VTTAALPRSRPMVPCDFASAHDLFYVSRVGRRSGNGISSPALVFHVIRGKKVATAV